MPIRKPRVCQHLFIALTLLGRRHHPKVYRTSDPSTTLGRKIMKKKKSKGRTIVTTNKNQYNFIYMVNINALVIIKISYTHRKERQMEHKRKKQTSENGNIEENVRFSILDLCCIVFNFSQTFQYIGKLLG